VPCFELQPKLLLFKKILLVMLGIEFREGAVPLEPWPQSFCFQFVFQIRSGTFVQADLGSQCSYLHFLRSWSYRAGPFFW
jgi:hypothetical protein